MVFQKNELEGVFATAVFKESTGVEAEMGSALQSWRSVPVQQHKNKPRSSQLL